jgi:hypothetical protein
VEILKTSVDGFLQTIGNKMLLEAGVKITLLDKAPDLGKSDGPYKGKKRKPRHEDRAPRQNDRNDRGDRHEGAPEGKKKSKFSEAIPPKKRPKKPSVNPKNKGKRRKPNLKG